MKRSIMAILLAAVLLIGAAFLIAPEAKAAINAHADGASAHCVCCDTAIGVGSHTCDATVTWTAVSSHSEIVSAVAANCNIYLTQDIQLTGRITISKTVNLCLNGNTLTAVADKGAFIVTTANGNLSITDCSAGNTGKLVGGINNGNGGTIAGNSDTTINIFAGTITGGTASYTKSSQYGGGNIYSAATLNIYGGTISNGTATDNVLGGNIYSKGGTLNIYGGSVTGGTSTGSDKGGGNIYATGALNISGGTISNGTAQAYYGGNIYATGALNISGGTISNGTAQANYGGNIYVSGTLNIDGGKDKAVTIADGSATRGANLLISSECTSAIIKNVNITGGTATRGGNIWDYSSESTYENAIITGGKATSIGGGNLFFGNGPKLLTNCTVTGGTSEGTGSNAKGGNIYNFSSAVTVDGGLIEGGTAQNGAGCIFLSTQDSATLTVQGAPKISSVYLSTGKTITVGTLTTGAAIGVEMQELGTIATGLTASPVDYFFSAILGHTDTYADGTLSLTAYTHTHCVCGGGQSGVGDHTCDATPRTWTAVSTAAQIAEAIEAGNLNLCLVENIQLAGTINVYKDTSLSICLNSYDLSLSSGNVFRTGGELNITDCKYDAAAGTGGTVSAKVTNGVLYMYGGSTVNIYGGYFKNTRTTGGGVFYLNATAGTVQNLATNADVTLNLYNGTVYNGGYAATGNNQLVTLYGRELDTDEDTVIDTYTYATFNMYGGVIDGKKVQNAHASIYSLSEYTKIHIYGGIVKDGNSTTSGGNIYAAGELIIDGGETKAVTISGGSSAGYGGNICIANSVTNLSIRNATISGGTVTNAKSSRGGNLYINFVANEDPITIYNCVITGGTSAYRGGNVYLNDGEIIFENCTISNGNAPEGAGIGVFNKVTNLTLTGTTTFSNNTSPASLTGKLSTDIYGFFTTGTPTQLVVSGLTNAPATPIQVAYDQTSVICADSSYIGYFAPAIPNATITSENGVKFVLPSAMLTVNGENCFSFADAFAHLPEGAVVILRATPTEELSLNVNATINFNGYSATLTLGDGVQLNGVDSTTDSFSQTGVASVTIKGTGTVAPTTSVTEPAILRYLTIDKGNGVYQFHRFYVGITAGGIQPAKDALGVQVTFAGTEDVWALMPIGNFGFLANSNKVANTAKIPDINDWDPSVAPENRLVAKIPASVLDGTGAVRVAYYTISGIFNSNDLIYNFRAYIEFSNDLTIQSFGVSHLTPVKVLNSINDNFTSNSYNQEQRQAVYDMVVRLKETIADFETTYGALNNILGYNETANKVYKDFLDLGVANSSMQEDALRDLVVAAMEAQLKLQWTPNETLEYNVYWRPSVAESERNPQSFIKDTLYGGLRYVSETGGSLYNFLHYYNPTTGKLDVTALKAALGTEDSATLMSVLANQCSSATYWAWSRLTPDLDYVTTGNMHKISGVTYLVDIPASYTDIDKLSGTEWEAMIGEIGKDALVAAYANLKKGDGITSSGHSMMVKENYPDKGYLVIYDQSQDGASTDPSYQSASAYTEKTLYYAKTDFSDYLKNDSEFLYESFCLPFTLNAFTSGSIDKATVASTLKYGTELTAAELFSDATAFDSNYPISYITMNVLDDNGNVVNRYNIYNAHLASNNKVFKFNGGTSMNVGSSITPKPGAAVAQTALAELAAGTKVQITATVGTGETLNITTVVLAK